MTQDKYLVDLSIRKDIATSDGKRYHIFYVTQIEDP